MLCDLLCTAVAGEDANSDCCNGNIGVEVRRTAPRGLHPDRRQPSGVPSLQPVMPYSQAARLRVCTRNGLGVALQSDISGGGLLAFDAGFGQVSVVSVFVFVVSVLCRDPILCVCRRCRAQRRPRSLLFISSSRSPLHTCHSHLSRSAVRRRHTVSSVVAHPKFSPPSFSLHRNTHSPLHLERWSLSTCTPTASRRHASKLLACPICCCFALWS